MPTLTALAVSAAQEAGKRLWEEWKEQRSWKVAIAADDDLFVAVNQWLMDHHETLGRRALLARTERPPSGPDQPSIPQLRFLIDGETRQRITVDGHGVEVFVDGPGTPAAGRPGPVQSERFLPPPRLVFQARSQAGRDAVVDLMRRLDQSRQDEKRKPGLMVLDRWSHWQRRSDLPARTMESVVAAGNVLEELYRDLRDFRDREGDYVRRGIPYHRAYLLTGPPGTGKTSAVKAITNALSMDLWYAQLSGIAEDVKLVDLLTEVRPHGVLLLEDIDSLTAATTRTVQAGSTKDISTAGLLNALDGVATPHGLVTILTTNHPERLDPALKRPGRIDRVIAFENPDSATICRHFAFFYGVEPASASFPEGRSSAAISEIFKRHMDNPTGAEGELLRPPGGRRL
ncbi:AAA family ATPase [Blastococcus sp. CCUG 61487]|uniref:AAA family ATPase n=1 Tax=Blastococcus sp. CCUG 61487 TaxID=1840703 RepID=UPI00148582AE|nr:AAA family ATPase [Blastococcus sp. CCUG 61487]